MLLPLSKLIDFNDEFAEFFSDQTGVQNIEHLECVYDFSPAAHCVRINHQEPKGWLLLRNKAYTYLLVEASNEKKEWRTWFAPDPKKVLEYLRQSFDSWPPLFPLIRQAHTEAHRSGDERPNLTHLEDLITKALHTTDYLSIISSQIKDPVPKKPTGT
jgi:hypothetical protein